MSTLLDKKFQVMLVREIDGKFIRQIESKTVSDLPRHDVIIRVYYSSLNYKDALSAVGHKGITRNYPHTPGIDAAGVVASSTSPNWKEGDEVLVTGYDLGMNTPGGFAEYISVPAEWVVARPKNLSLLDTMILGTAGFTAALSAYNLIDRGHLTPESGKILVTGATGGVGMWSLLLMKHLGFSVEASTGKSECRELLKGLGAEAVYSREEIVDREGRPLLKSRWAGVIDSVGGTTLGSVIRSTVMNGVVSCCGNVSDVEFKTTIFPFILRNVSLMGVASADTERELRQKMWDRLGKEWYFPVATSLFREVKLAEINDEIYRILHGQQVGRVVINLT